MTRAYRLMRLCIDRYSTVVTVIACASLIVTMVHVILDAVATKFFHVPLEGTFQFVTLYYMVALFFLPLGYVERQDAHISADLVFSLLPGVLKRWVGLTSQAVMVVFAGVLTWQAWQSALRQTRIGASEDLVVFHLLTWPSRWIAVVGLVSLTLVAALRLIDLFLNPEPAEVQA